MQLSSAASFGGFLQSCVKVSPEQPSVKADVVPLLQPCSYDVPCLMRSFSLLSGCINYSWSRGGCTHRSPLTHCLRRPPAGLRLPLCGAIMSHTLNLQVLATLTSLKSNPLLLKVVRLPGSGRLHLPPAAWRWSAGLMPRHAYTHRGLISAATTAQCLHSTALYM